MAIAILSLDEGVKEALKRIGTSTNRPVMAAIYGLPNSGKTFLIDKIAEMLERSRITVSRFHVTARRATFEAVRAAPPGPSQVHLYHCSWNKTKSKYLRPGDDDPNMLAMQVLGRKLDLNIGIYNPSISGKVKSDYAFVICNPDAQIKPPPA
ncbi:MAG TPA: hypothetical protein VI612_02885 [Candidatus Nanoarchaeia archaeon]|nr:hypothetical protein [Candidatus Nanoarchaeia archaeon]